MTDKLPDPITGLREVAAALTLVPDLQAAAEQGAASLRKSLQSHNVDLHDPRQLEAFTAGLATAMVPVYIMAEGLSGYPEIETPRAMLSALAVYFTEEKII